MIGKLLLNEKFIFILIILNSVLIFIQGYSIDSYYLNKIEYFDNFITTLFLAEFIVKLRKFGRYEYFSSMWNIFDFTLVVLALPSLVFFFLPSQIVDLDFLLAFRLLRVFKFFRFIRFIPNINKILIGFYKAAKSSVVIIIGFFVFNFVIGLVSCFFFRELSPEYFSDPLISFYSIFKIFTVEGWYDIPDSIVENLDSNISIFMTRLFFVLILLFGGIFGLSFVNSIFVDAMVSDNNLSLEKKIDNLEEKIELLISKNSSNPN
jgi:voltage-gated sodium channel